MGIQQFAMGSKVQGSKPGNGYTVSSLHIRPDRIRGPPNPRWSGVASTVLPYLAPSSRLSGAIPPVAFISYSSETYF